jgi:hypothetical protein
MHVKAKAAAKQLAMHAKARMLAKAKALLVCPNKLVNKLAAQVNFLKYKTGYSWDIRFFFISKKFNVY